MADEFTPITSQVRDAYSIDPEGEYRDPINAASNQRAMRRAFDRWLAQHDAEVLAAAQPVTLGVPAEQHNTKEGN